jgi:hypothetical protein
VILCQLPTMGARRPMEGVATEVCVRQCVQARAGVGLAVRLDIELTIVFFELF